MATVSVPYSFTNGNNADATQVNADFAALVNFINTEVVQRDASVAFTALPTLPSNPTLANQAARKAYVDSYFPVVTANITDANVTTAKIADANVTTAKIADASVTTAKIVDANVTTGKVADAAITTAKIADSNVTNAKLALGTFANIKGGAEYSLCGRLKQTTAQSITNNTATNLTFATETFDYSNMHSTVTNTDRVTIATAGTYHFSASVPFVANAAGGRQAAIIRYNSGGTAQEYVAFAAADAGDSTEVTSLSPSGLAECAAGDYLVVQVVQTSGAALNTYVDGFLLGLPMFNWHCVRVA